MAGRPAAPAGAPSPAAGRVLPALLAPVALAGCVPAAPDAAAWGFFGLALGVVAVGFFAFGRWRERSRGERLLRAARAEAGQWRALLPDVRWRSDASHRIVEWQAPSPHDAITAPAADALGAALRAERAFRGLRVDAVSTDPDRPTAWLLDGEPVLDDAGVYTGHVGSARPAAAEDARALAAAGVPALLSACPGPALLAARRGAVWQVERLNAPARALWPALEPGDALDAALAALPEPARGALPGLEDGQSAEVEGWLLARWSAGGAGDALLLARAGASAADAEAFGPTLSHDLRAPIRVVEGFTRIVKEDYGRLLDRVGNDHLDRVLGAAARMNLMIDALLTLARLSSQPLARQPVNLSQLAGFVIDDLRRAAPERVVEVEIEPGLSTVGDPTLLRILLENLLGNAWKYTARVPRARIALRRSAPAARGASPPGVRAGLESGARAGFEVADNGAGFDMRSAERLFGLFQRLHSTSEFPGHGVGLASVRRIVQRHGGEISASAAPGQGATFRFTLG